VPLFHPVGSGVRPKPSPFAFGGSVKSLRPSGPCRFGGRDRAEAPSFHPRSHLETLAGFQPRSPVPGSGRNPFLSPFSVVPAKPLRVFRIQPPVPRFGRSLVISPSLAVSTKPSEVSRPNPDSATRPKSRPFIACRFTDTLAGLRSPTGSENQGRSLRPFPVWRSLRTHRWVRSPSPFQDRTEIPSLPAWRLPDPLAVLRSPASVPRFGRSLLSSPFGLPSYPEGFLVPLGLLHEASHPCKSMRASPQRPHGGGFVSRPRLPRPSAIAAL